MFLLLSAKLLERVSSASSLPIPPSSFCHLASIPTIALKHSFHTVRSSGNVPVLVFMNLFAAFAMVAIHFLHLSPLTSQHYTPLAAHPLGLLCWLLLLLLCPLHKHRYFPSSLILASCSSHFACYLGNLILAHSPNYIGYIDHF